MSDNLKLWNAVCTTLPSHTKPAKIGQMNITAICPQSQRKYATEQFGPFGIGWGITGETWEYMDIGETRLCHYSATLWYIMGDKRGEFPITANVKVSYVTQGGKGYLLVDDEFSKKVQTNALTKGLSALGFNSDVFEGKYDDNKYVQEQRQAESGGGDKGQGQKVDSQPSSKASQQSVDDLRKQVEAAAKKENLEMSVVELYCKNEADMDYVKMGVKNLRYLLKMIQGGKVFDPNESVPF
jgi:hypothetical protein